MDITKLKEIFGEWPLRVCNFEKISYEQFRKDWLATYSEPNDADLREEPVIRDAYDTITLPVRGTNGSGGYDFVSPLSFTLEPGEDIVILTGIKVRLDIGWTLEILPRSGMGSKYYFRLANTTGLIDSDYADNPKNEGHILAKVRNEGTIPMVVNKGDRFCQGVTRIYGISTDDNATDTRNGGFGSTGK